MHSDVVALQTLPGQPNLRNAGLRSPSLSAPIGWACPIRQIAELALRTAEREALAFLLQLCGEARSRGLRDRARRAPRDGGSSPGQRLLPDFESIEIGFMGFGGLNFQLDQYDCGRSCRIGRPQPLLGVLTPSSTYYRATAIAHRGWSTEPGFLDRCCGTHDPTGAAARTVSPSISAAKSFDWLAARCPALLAKAHLLCKARSRFGV